MSTTRLGSAALLGVVLITSPATTQGSNHPADIIDTAVAAGSFTNLATALDRAGLVKTLKGKGPFTVFAPTDAAVAKLPEGALQGLLADPAALRTVLTYHVVAGALRAEEVLARTSLTSVQGQRLGLSIEDGNARIAGARIVKTDITCSNGVIHVIDAVMMPEQKDIVAVAQAAGSFGVLLRAAQAAGLVDALQSGENLTVFAPTDEAFEKLGKKTITDLLKPGNAKQLARILKFHVVPARVYSDQAAAAGRAATLQGDEVRVAIQDGRLRINDAAVVANDIAARNGVIHVIDSVLMPPQPRGRKFFGLQYEAPGQALAAQLGLDRHKTLVITKVIDDTAAAEAGLRRYDVVTRVDGRPATGDQITDAKNRYGYGDRVQFEVIRGGKTVQLHIAVGEERS